MLDGFRGGVRASVGLGVSLRMMELGNLKAAVAQPHWTQQHDIMQRRQLGFARGHGRPTPQLERLSAAVPNEYPRPGWGCNTRLQSDRWALVANKASTSLRRQPNNSTGHSQSLFTE